MTALIQALAFQSQLKRSSMKWKVIKINMPWEHQRIRRMIRTVDTFFGNVINFGDLEQVTLKPRLQVDHCLTTWLQIWYHSLLWGDYIRKGADLEKQ